MTFELKPLPYPSDALEPHIDARTMEIHHGKHHATYVTNLNNALKDQAELASLSLNQLISHLEKVPEGLVSLADAHFTVELALRLIWLPRAVHHALQV